MKIVVLRSYGDYVILLNSLRKTTLKHNITLIVSSHLHSLHEALKLNFANNINISFIDFKIQKGLLSFFTNKYFLSLGTIKELISIREYFKNKKKDSYYLENKRKSLLLQILLGIKFKSINHKNNIYKNYNEFFQVQLDFNFNQIVKLNQKSTIIIFSDSRKKNKMIDEKTISKLVSILNKNFIHYKIATFSLGNENKKEMSNKIVYSNFSDLVDIIKKADFIISSDSLPVHIAELYDIPHWILYNHQINTQWLTPSSSSLHYYSTFDQINQLNKIFHKLC